MHRHRPSQSSDRCMREYGQLSHAFCQSEKYKKKISIGQSILGMERGTGVNGMFYGIFCQHHIPEAKKTLTLKVTGLALMVCTDPLEVSRKSLIVDLFHGKTS